MALIILIVYAKEKLLESVMLDGCGNGQNNLS